MTIIIWIAGVLPFAVTAALLNFLPEMVPMHFGFDGNRVYKNELEKGGN